MVYVLVFKLHDGIRIVCSTLMGHQLLKGRWICAYVAPTVLTNQCSLRIHKDPTAWRTHCKRACGTGAVRTTLAGGFYGKRDLQKIVGTSETQKMVQRDEQQHGLDASLLDADTEKV